MIIRRFFSLFLSFSFLFFGYGCKKGLSYDLSYTQKSFCAQVEGNQFGLDFCCDIYCEEGRLTKIIYSSPVALKDVTICRLADGSFLLQKDGLSDFLSQDTAASFGLLLPARRLLLEGVTRSSVNSVQKLSNGFLLTATPPNEGQSISVLLGNDGFPSVISGENFSYRVRIR